MSVPKLNIKPVVQKQGVFRKAIAKLALPTAFVLAPLVAGIITSCSEKDNPAGFRGSDTTRTKDSITNPIDSTRLNPTERATLVPGYILANFEGAQKIVYEDDLVTLSSGDKVKIDFIGLDSTDNSKIVADVKVWRPITQQDGSIVDSLVVSERNAKSGQVFVVPGTSILVSIEDVDFDNQDGSVDRALLRKPRNPLKNENYGSTFAIVSDGDKTLVAYTKDGLKIADNIDAVVFTGHEGNNRVQVKDGFVYSIAIPQVPLTNNVNAQVEGIGNFPDTQLTFTLEMKDNTPGSTGVWEVTLPPLSAQGTTQLTTPISMPLKSKDTVNYQCIFDQVTVSGGPFLTGYPNPNNLGYETGTGDYPTYVISLNAKVVNGSGNEVPYHVYVRITNGTPNGDVRVGQHIDEKGINVNATLNIKSVQ